ncbi:Vtc4 polyphosphate synthetase [Cladochytrium replicatum]|nr:Vtc4 polyphosphate synthetase [Cladochytrium replicatum]
MKFGHDLFENVFPEWRFYYIDYKDLKREVKERMTKGFWAEEDEEEFFKLLDRERTKIIAFRNLLRAELKARRDAIEFGVNSMRLEAAKDSAGGRYGEVSDEDRADRKATREARLVQAETDIQELIDQVRELAKYTRLNFTGIMKILKKHDKRTDRNLALEYQTVLQEDPIHVDTYYEQQVIELSQMYDEVRRVREGKRGDEGPGVDAGNIVRKTTKYWVHPDNVLEVKLRVLQHLPVLIFNGGEVDPAISSVYFDNADFDLYHNRIIRDEGAQNLRFRWYGQWDKTEEVWVERKTHHEAWVGIKSIKERFPIKECYLNDYLAGRYDIREQSARMREDARRSGKLRDQKDVDKLEKKIADMERLADSVQKIVIERKLRPMIRTTYNRTAFQLPADARVRISLDTELALIREDDFDRVRAGENWRWRHVKNQWPFSYLDESDIVRFPYAILEIKLQTQTGQQVPQWAVDLANSHLVEAVPKFSKFHHAVSTLLNKHVTMVPFWFYQMDRDIRKPQLDQYAPDQTYRDELREMGQNQTGIFLPPPAKKKLTYEERQNLPVKIDQFGKVYFSNERTMLRWLNFGIQSLAISVAFLNLATSLQTKYFALFFIILSMSAMLYAIVTFHIRAKALRTTDASTAFGSITAPAVAVSFLSVAIVVQFIWVWAKRGFV